MDRKASAIWLGNLKQGKGTVSTTSRVLRDTPYSFTSRFEQGTGTNPEELLAAAHAGCFAMALSAELGNAGITPQKLEVSATVTIDLIKGSFVITKSHLDLTAHLPQSDKNKVEAAIKAAKDNCPVSKLFKAEITLSQNLIYQP